MTEDPYYKSRYTFDPRRSIIWGQIVEFESKYIPENSTVVDLGAGYCDFINNVKAAKKYAVDISAELPNYAGNEVAQISSSVTDLSGISTSSVDIVHASNLLEHFSDSDLEMIMNEIERVLKSGGKLILMQPNYRLSHKNYFDDPTHKKVFSDASLESFLISHGFKIILKKPRFLPFSMKSNSSLIPHTLLGLIVRLYIKSPIKPFAGQMLFIAEKKDA